MKRLKSAVTEEYELEVIECDCGFHIGIDATYLQNVEDIRLRCFACDTEIDTAVVCPE